MELEDILASGSDAEYLEGRTNCWLHSRKYVLLTAAQAMQIRIPEAQAVQYSTSEFLQLVVISWNISGAIMVEDSYDSEEAFCLVSVMLLVSGHGCGFSSEDRKLDCPIHDDQVNHFEIGNDFAVRAGTNALLVPAPKISIDLSRPRLLSGESWADQTYDGLPESKPDSLISVYAPTDQCLLVRQWRRDPGHSAAYASGGDWQGGATGACASWQKFLMPECFASCWFLYQVVLR